MFSITNSPNNSRRINSQLSNNLQHQNSTEYQSKSKLFDEIGILMRAFGDVSDAELQIKESIILVEKILIHQLTNIIHHAQKIAYNRTGTSVPHQIDFEFMMYRNKPKITRFRKYMRNVQKIQCKNEQQKSLGMNFLNRISEEGSDDEQEIYDAEKIRRIYRADRISQILSPKSYENYQKARTWSSNTKNKRELLRKLVDILQIPKEIQENSNCLEIIQFLTQETIATIVDFAILTRLNSENLAMEPKIVSSNLSNEMLQLCTEVTQGRGGDGIRPIKVSEIQEAMRRVQLMHNQKKLGNFRNMESKFAFLAL